jgi:hypothetical protein
MLISFCDQSESEREGTDSLTSPHIIQAFKSAELPQRESDKPIQLDRSVDSHRIES